MNDGNLEMLAELRRLRRLTLWLMILVPILLLAAVGAGFWFGAHRSEPKVVSNNTDYIPAAAAPSATPAPPEISAITEKSIAVLPFQTLSSDRQRTDLADNVQRQILSKLASVPDLRVINSGSVMQQRAALRRSPREVGQQLGVAYLLEGSVRRARNRVIVEVRLIDAARDNTVWSESYDSEPNDVFTVENEIAKAVADQLGVKISLAEK